MQRYYVLNKNKLINFLSFIQSRSKLAAPVKKGEKSYAFEYITDLEKIALHYLPTILPVKKYFLPQRETLIEFNKKTRKTTHVIEFEELTLFGVHTCDLVGMQCLNAVMVEDPKDINYLERKNKLTVIAFECNSYCDEHATCGIMRTFIPSSGYDILFTEFDTYFLIHIGTTKGSEIVNESRLFDVAQKEHFDELNKLRKRKEEIFKPEINASYDELKKLMERACCTGAWEGIFDKCLSCGTCTNVCPTCYCFDINDDIDLNLLNGCRMRTWDSCQNEGFAKVAGGENFREERKNRQVHRYMRKFKYPVDKYNMYFCTGCGRCSRACVAKISLKETMNLLSERIKL